MTLQEIQYKAQGIIHKWRDDDSAPYIEFVEELAHMTVPEPSEDLEEAAEEYSKKVSDGHNYRDLQVGFIAGAKWQKERDEMSKVNYEGARAVYDNTVQHLQEKIDEKYELGKRDMKEQMLKEAVEYEVWDFSSSLEACPHITIPLDNKQYRNGDKVRVIVLPKEKE